MIHRSISLAAAVLFIAITTAAAQSTLHLHTADTLLRFSPGDAAPSLLTLQSPGHTPWTNTTPELLIDHVDSEGRHLPLHWQFNRQLSSHDSHTVTFVYDSASLHLRLTWTWRARAAYGPIEHQIHITNLDPRE